MRVEASEKPDGFPFQEPQVSVSPPLGQRKQWFTHICQCFETREEAWAFAKAAQVWLRAFEE